MRSISINPLKLSTLYNKKFDRLKQKSFADDKINVTEKWKFVLGRVENTVGKGENAGYQHFLLFPQCFQKIDKSRDFVLKGQKLLKLFTTQSRLLTALRERAFEKKK